MWTVKAADALCADYSRLPAFAKELESITKSQVEGLQCYRTLHAESLEATAGARESVLNPSQVGSGGSYVSSKSGSDEAACFYYIQS